MDDNYAVSKNLLVNKTETSHERKLKAALDASAVNWLWLQHVHVEGYYPDLYEPTSRICIEVDGEYHDTPKKQLLDLKRDLVLQEHGILTIRFKNKRIDADIEACITQIEQNFRNRLQVALVSHDEYEPLDVVAIRARIASASNADPLSQQSLA